MTSTVQFCELPGKDSSGQVSNTEKACEDEEPPPTPIDPREEFSPPEHPISMMGIKRVRSFKWPPIGCKTSLKSHMQYYIREQFSCRRRGAYGIEPAQGFGLEHKGPSASIMQLSKNRIGPIRFDYEITSESFSK